MPPLLSELAVLDDGNEDELPGIDGAELDDEEELDDEDELEEGLGNEGDDGALLLDELLGIEGAELDDGDDELGIEGIELLLELLVL